MEITVNSKCFRFDEEIIHERYLKSSRELFFFSIHFYDQLENVNVLTVDECSF